jgi:hypothetical protein
VADLKTMKWGMSDGGYHLKNYVITPVANTNTDTNNDVQIRTQNPVEQSFWVWEVSHS